MYHYEESGLDYIWLRNGYETIDTPHGPATSIHHLDELHRVIGMHIVEKQHLSADELRFLRIELNMSQADLAGVLEVNESTYRNWERSRRPVPGAAAKVVKLLYLGLVNGDQTIKGALELLRQESQSALGNLELEEVGDGWRAAA